MTRLTDQGLIGAWEVGASRPPAERALAILAQAIGPSEAPLGSWPVGRRDAALLDVHAGTFGERLDACIACPKCSEPLELALRAGELRAGSAEPGEEHELEAAGHRVAFRPATGDDLVACGRADPADARRAIVERCVTGAWDVDGAPVPARELPEPAIDALDEAMGERDPQAHLRLALTCSECDHAWATALDVAAFVWREVEWCAQSLLGEVAALAAAYGWDEGSVLALSPARRRTYLELAGA
jgi:hypothetical protein